MLYIYFTSFSFLFKPFLQEAFMSGDIDQGNAKFGGQALDSSGQCASLKTGDADVL